MASICIICQLNDGAVLGGAIRSVRGWVDEVVVVDGSWYGYAASSDDSHAVAGAEGAVWVEAQDWSKLGPGEQSAREFALSMFPSDVVVLFMDADERLIAGGNFLGKPGVLGDAGSGFVVLTGSLGLERDSGRAVFVRRLFRGGSLFSGKGEGKFFPIVIRNSPELRPVWRADERLREPRYSDSALWLKTHGNVPF